MKKFFWGAAAVVVLAVTLAILAGNVGVFFGVVALAIAEVILYSAQEYIKKQKLLRNPLRLLIWSVMWFMLGSVGTIVSLIHQRFGGAELSSDIAGIIFLAPIGVAVCWIAGEILYAGIVWYENKLLR